MEQTIMINKGQQKSKINRSYRSKKKILKTSKMKSKSLFT